MHSINVVGKVNASHYPNQGTSRIRLTGGDVKNFLQNSLLLAASVSVSVFMGQAVQTIFESQADRDCL